MLKYAPGTQHLVCHYCGQANEIKHRLEQIHEYDFHEALQELARAKPTTETKQVSCEACGASFKFEDSIHAGECPFCGTDIVTSITQARPIQPKSLLPFLITEKQAKAAFRKWLGSRWFSPGKMKKYAREEAKLTGVYCPYWTYDSYTETKYTGDRGDVYYENQRVEYYQNGRLVSSVRRVPNIHWTPVRGKVGRFFDDVLVGASLSLPRQILDRLQPWDLENLVPYDEQYLSGFRSEYYQVDLDEGFDHAKQVMHGVIYQDITFDIGGSHQRVHHINTDHRDTTYKHCLLPIWAAGFLYRDRTYRFVVNARTGRVQGERPYSYLKIGLAVVTGSILLLGTVFYLDQAGVFNQAQFRQYSYGY